jgi:hypothetical protein
VGRILGSQCAWRTGSSDDDGHSTADQICGQWRQLFVVALCPSIFGSPRYGLQ